MVALFKSPLFYRKATPSPSVTTLPAVTFEQLATHINEVMEPLNGSFSVYVYNLSDNREFGINQNTIYTAASVNKIPILATLYHDAGNGDVDLDKMVTVQQEDVQDYGTGSIRYDPVGTSYSIKTLARLMMEKSDNTAAHLLGKLILSENHIQDLVNSWGMKQTNIADNKTSAKDMSMLLIKMYKGEITNQALTAEMLDFMDKSDYEDRIPRLLPSDVTVYHKIGDEVGKIHDVGIVVSKKSTYYVGIFTTDQTDEQAAKTTIANVSKLIFDAMN
jgi:beta-lactamase class A